MPETPPRATPAKAKKLNDAQREWIVRRLAAYESPSAIRREVRARFGVEIGRATIARYDRSRHRRGTKRWIALLCSARRDHDASRADLTAAVRQVARLVQRIVELLERRILAGPGRVRRGMQKDGPITDEDRLHAIRVFVATMRVSNPAGYAEIRRVCSDGTRKGG